MTISNGSTFFQRLLSLKEQSDSAAKGRQHRSRSSTLSRISTFLESGKIVVMGAYELHSKLGQGGLGEVYSATHLESGTRVAVKILLPEGNKDFGDALGKSDLSQTQRQRFLREIQAAATVRSEFVVRALDAGQDFGLEIFVMEWVDGLDVGHILKRVKQIPLACACEIGRQAAIGLCDIKRAGFVHRDIKPSNLMLSLEGRLKILDLGLSRPDASRAEKEGVEEITRMHALMGTAEYLSPEQALDARTADIRSDLYSLGCTLFKLLSGRAPYTEERHNTFQKKLLAHREEPIPDLSKLRPDAPPALCWLITQMLAKSVSERIQEPSHVVRQLSPYCHGSQLGALVQQAKYKPTLSQPDEEDEATASLIGNVPASASASTDGKDRSLRIWSRRNVLAAGAAGTAAVALGSYNLMKRLRPLTFHSLHLFEEIPLRKVNYNASDNTLQLSSPHLEMTEVVSSEVGAGVAEITIGCEGELLSDVSRCGIFLGLRPMVGNGQPGYCAQVIVIERRDNPKLGIVNQFHIVRQLAMLNQEGIQGTLDQNYRYDAMQHRHASEPIAPPKRKQFQLRVEYTQNSIQKIIVDGKEMTALCGPAMDSAYSPQDFASPLGIYSKGRGIAVISDMHFSSPAQ